MGIAPALMKSNYYDPIAAALKEDIGDGDVMTDFFVPESLHATGRIIAHEKAVVAGIGVYVIWVGLDPYYPKIEFLFKAGNPWNPFKQFGEASAMGWFFVAVRTIGSALVVPPIEEAFYRSFLYRYFIRLDFQNLPFNQLHWLSLIVTSLLFGLAHYQWLGGVLCGLIFQSLVLRKNRLGDAMTAHAITNFLLGIWIVWKGDWKFW